MIRKPKFVHGMIAVAVALASVGCGVSLSSAAVDARGPSVIPLLRVGAPTSVQNLDPAKQTGCAAICFYEHLLTFGPDGKVKGHLATSWSHPNAVTYVYQLRRGVKFWDGTEMTSADVVNSLNHQATQGTTTATYYANVKRIRARGRYTAVVTLNRPDASWLTTLAWQGAIFQKRFQQEHAATFGNPGTLPIATGPWKIDRFDPTRGIEFSANPNWWGGKVPVQRISVKYFTSDQSAALAFRAGELDVAFPGDARVFASTSGAKVSTAPSCQQGYLIMNAKIPPWNDIHVRRAVAYALNRAGVATAAGGFKKAAYYFIPPAQLRVLGSEAQVNAVLKSVPRYTFDLAKAKAEMARSAHPRGFSASTDATTSAFGDFVTTSQAIAGQLKEIGIDLTVESIPLGQWLSTVFTGPKSHGITFTTVACPQPDPSWYPSFLLGSKNTAVGGSNIANYAPPDVDRLISQAATTQNPGKRLALYGQLLRKVALDLPYLPLYQNGLYLALSSKLSWPGWKTGPYYAYQLWPLELKQK